MDIHQILGTSIPQVMPRLEQPQHELNEYGLCQGVSENLCKEVNDKLKQICKDQKECNDILEFLNMLAEVDIETVEHSIRVGILCNQIAELFNIERKSLIFPGLLHDMGKCRIPKSILQKKGGLDENEREVLREHPYNTFIIVEKRFKFSALIGYYHHMHQPNGYPKKTIESEVPFSNETLEKIYYYSKILAIADFFDAAVTRRNNKYGKDSLSVQEAVQKLKDDKPNEKELIDKINEADLFNKHMIWVRN